MKLPTWHLILFAAFSSVLAEANVRRQHKEEERGARFLPVDSDGPNLVRQHPADHPDAGTPVMNLEDRDGLGLDTDGAATEEPWRDVHRGFFSTYTGARNDLETPIAMRTQFIYWKIQLAVLAATKKHDIDGLEMLDPFPTEDDEGNQVYSVPEYKLPEDQLDDLYQSEEEIKEFRAKAAACALYHWWEIGLSQYMQDEPRLQDMKEYLLDLANEPSDRTHFGFDAWRNEWDFTVDVTAPCMEISGNKGNAKAVGNAKVIEQSPQCVGEAIRETLLDWQRDDGWNQLGTDRNTGQLQPKPFKDVIGYQATHIANTGGAGRNWAPLTECKSGFCANQEHVVPHIGFTARTYFLSKEDRKNIVSGVVKPLIVDYKEEMNKIWAAMIENVVESPLYKTKIAYHDNKFFFAAGTRQIRGNNKNTWEEQIFMQNCFLGVEYEGIIINWMAKVLNDHVRPTTVAQELFGDEEIASWQYGSDTPKMYPAREWTPYIRQMPHGEFPSGSACLCSGGASIYAEMFNRPYDDPSLGVTINYNNYVNSVEPERFKDFDFEEETYSSIKAYADECAQSRFYGGMHYEFSLEPGSRMCTTDGNFTKKAAAFNKYLWTGNADFLEPYGGKESFGYKGDRGYEWY